jgi:hypothetical protein
MSLSLLMALLDPKHESSQPASDPDDPNLKRDYDDWHQQPPEKQELKQELMLQALYLALNEVLYEQAAMDPEARRRNRVLRTSGMSYVQTGKPEDPPQAGRAVGTLLAQAVGNDPAAHPLANDDKQELRRELRKELRAHLTRLREQFS